MASTGPNSKARNAELQNIAAEILAASGIDVNSFPVDTRTLSKLMAEKSGCHYTTAKQHIAKAMRRARYKIVQEREWGGYRKGAGRPKEKIKE